MDTPDADSPNINVHVTPPDGVTRSGFLTIPARESGTRVGECYLQYGPHRFAGDLKHYDMTVAPVNDVGVDLRFDAHVKPFRPGTGYIGFGDDGDPYYTWLCVAKGSVSGIVTVDGKSSAREQGLSPTGRTGF